MGPMQILRPLRRRALRHFLLASLISSAGTGMAMIAGKLYVHQTTGRNSLVGLLGAVGFAAGILAMGRLGTLIDRYNRKWVMIGADLYRLLLGAVVPVALWAGVFTPGHLFVVVFLMGFGHTVGYPNLSAMVGEIAPIEERPWVNGLIEVCMQVGMMGGAAFSGLLYRQGGIGLVYLVDMATFLISALLFYTMPFEPRDQDRALPGPAEESDFAAGWRYLWERPLLMVYGLAATLPWVATMAFNTVLPGLVYRRLHGGSLEVGILDAAYALGGVLAGLAGGVAMRGLGVRVGMLLTLTLGGVCMLQLTAVEGVAPAFPLALGFGLGNSSFRVIHRTFVLHKVPNRVLGRVLSFYAWAGISGSALGMLLAGRAMDTYGEAAGIRVLALAQGCALLFVAGLGARGFFMTEARRPEKTVAPPEA